MKGNNKGQKTSDSLFGQKFAHPSMRPFSMTCVFSISKDRDKWKLMTGLTTT